MDRVRNVAVIASTMLHGCEAVHATPEPLTVA